MFSINRRIEMFPINNVIGWLGSLAIVKTSDGYWLVDWGNDSKRLFAHKDADNGES